MKNLLLATLLLAPAWAAAKKAPSAAAAEDKKPAAGSADEETVKLTNIVIKTPTAELDPVLAGAFLKVDVDTLPQKLRRMARGKQLELRSLITIAEGKKKGAIRMVGADACVIEKLTPADISVLRQVGYVEASELGVDGAEKQTQCTELDMQCQFTMRIVNMPKGSEPPRRFFFQEKDPILAIVQLHEQGAKNRQTNFFGAGYLACQH